MTTRSTLLFALALLGAPALAHGGPPHPHAPPAYGADAVRPTRPSPVLAPVLVTHHGAAPVYVQVGSLTGFWALPGQQQRLDLPLVPGATVVPVTTSVYGPRGLVPVDTQALVLVPGRLSTMEVGWTAASTITLTNLESRPVRVYVGGYEAAAVGVGQTTTFSVAPGRYDVLVLEERGRVLFDQAVSFDPRRDHRVLLAGATGTMTVQTTTTSTTPLAVAPPSPPPSTPQRPAYR
jgi:hypothetical protein